jgi:hypothetical protein
LKSLVVRGDAQFGGYYEDDLDNVPRGIAQAVTDVSFQGQTWMKSPQIWLSSIRLTVRRLDLTGIRTSKCVGDVVFPQLEILEHHWCSRQLLKGVQLPSLKYYSESIELGPRYGEDRAPLSIIQGYFNQLRVIILRGDYSEYWGGTRALLNIDGITTQMELAKTSGSLKFAFIEGSFVLPSPGMFPWLRCLGPIDYGCVKDRSNARLSLLKDVDQKRRFSETRSDKMTHLGAQVSVPWDKFF